MTGQNADHAVGLTGIGSGLEQELLATLSNSNHHAGCPTNG
ncbi:MAG: hypothetical protein RLZZ166_54, partial [Pseudomonadota bacterium]